jgi:tetratricopeptide (TPR) repeat protein
MGRMTIPQALSLGMNRHQTGQLQEAESIYRQILALKPNDPDALHLLGVLAQQCGHSQAAVDLIQKSLAVTPANSAALTNLGEALRVLGRHDQAIAALQKSLEIRVSPEAIGNLGIVYADIGKTDQAIECYQKALAITANQPRVLNNLGNALLSKKDMDGALSAFDRALALDPNFADGHNNRGSALEQLDRLDEALSEYTRAFELQPTFAIACNNAGNLTRRLCQWDAATAWIQRSLQLNPKYEPAIWNLGLIELTRGDYPNGLPKYEMRFVATENRLPTGLNRPRWDGSPLEGRTILLCAEQGFGDCWQAARYMPMIAGRGGRIVIECHPSQVKLMQNLEGVVQAFASGEPRPDYDVFEAIMSLPLRLGTTLETIPRDVPYLKPNPDRIWAWGEKFAGISNLKVGLVWAGSHHPDPLRRISLAELAPVAAVPDVQFIGLQIGKAGAEARETAAWSSMIDVSEDLTDFGETAACMMNLDLILTVDTAAAHLAGALGRPTWTLLPFSPDWRWLLDREDAVWYPTMRLFRQTQRKVWTDVVERVVSALDEFKNPRKAEG